MGKEWPEDVAELISKVYSFVVVNTNPVTNTQRYFIDLTPAGENKYFTCSFIFQRNGCSFFPVLRMACANYVEVNVDGCFNEKGRFVNITSFNVPNLFYPREFA